MLEIEERRSGLMYLGKEAEGEQMSRGMNECQASLSGLLEDDGQEFVMSGKCSLLTFIFSPCQLQDDGSIKGLNS